MLYIPTQRDEQTGIRSLPKCSYYKKLSSCVPNTEMRVDEGEDGITFKVQRKDWYYVSMLFLLRALLHITLYKPTSILCEEMQTAPSSSNNPSNGGTYNLLSLSLSLIFFRTLISSLAASRYFPTFLIIFKAT